MQRAVHGFVVRRWGVESRAVNVRLEPVPGGLESTIGRVHLQLRSPRRGVPDRLIVKQVGQCSRREIDVYRLLWRQLPDPPLARVYGVDESPGPDAYLFLEDVAGGPAWPWANLDDSASVCRVLARLHDEALAETEVPSALTMTGIASAEETLSLALAARHRTGERVWNRMGDLRRVVAALPAMRRTLEASGTVLIHGDVHPGNVLVRAGATPTGGVVLIDWARARLGSPLEDVASWLHALGCWEPQARRRHDTLLRIYLGARRVRRALDTGLRIEYWLASACNGLAGAIRYHVAIAADPASSDEQRCDAGRALRAWERVIRRAADVLSATGCH